MPRNAVVFTDDSQVLNRHPLGSYAAPVPGVVDGVIWRYRPGQLDDICATDVARSCGLLPDSRNPFPIQVPTAAQHNGSTRYAQLRKLLWAIPNPRADRRGWNGRCVSGAGWAAEPGRGLEAAASGGNRARFQAEAPALAPLNHPSIAFEAPPDTPHCFRRRSSARSDSNVPRTAASAMRFRISNGSNCRSYNSSIPSSSV